MVQVISLDKLTPQKLDKIDTKDVKLTNTDFLELLLKDMDKDSKGEQEETSTFLDDDTQLSDIKIDEKDLKLEPKLQFNLKNIEIKDLDTKNSKLKEIKNIITSKFKQENILLSKQEIKEFKSIDNLKDLIKFADKKGLNIEKLKFELPLQQTKVEDKKVILNEVKILNKIEKHKSTEKKIVSNDVIKNTKDESTKTEISLEQIINLKSKSKKTTKTDIKSEQLKHKDLKKDSKIIHKNIKTLETKELKIEKQSKEIKEVNILKEEIKNTDKKIEPKKISLETLLDKKIDSKNTQKTSKNIDLESMLNLKEEIKPKEKKIDIHILNQNQQTMVNELKAKSVQAKETITHFKNNLDEAIKNYKPPVSKVNIELNPQNLGKVEVTIIQRGNNIQVNMNTDQNNVMLFQTHQAEFRQALANIGFSNIDMSFNSNQDKEKKQNQAKKAYKENENS